MAKTTDKVAAEATLERGHRKTRRGYVSSDKMDKTIVVEVEDRVKHPLYGKVIRRTSKVKVHDETNSAGVGDLVVIYQSGAYGFTASPQAFLGHPVCIEVLV